MKVHDTSLGRRISFIERKKGSPRPNLYKASLVWEKDNTLLIGWADMVKIGTHALPTASLFFYIALLLSCPILCLVLLLADAAVLQRW